MPGIVGFSYSDISESKAKQTLRKMRQLITHKDFYVQDDIFCDSHLCASRSHKNITQKYKQPYPESGLFVWLDGEFYNQTELNNKLSTKAYTDPALLLTLYTQYDDFSFLNQIDGFYSAIIYDANLQKIFLISDRYGLRQLYWSIHRGQLVWSSEVKSMLALPGFEVKIDSLALEEFFSIGQLLENRTWFEGVELLPSAAILTWDIRKQSYSIERYWDWNDVKSLTGKIDVDEIAEELGRIFIKSVEKRCQPNERIGVTLSGGLDSRSILAALPQYVDPIHVITFGKAGCDDVRIAAVAARRKGATHHIFEINESNWLNNRMKGIWWTDGQLNMVHMHGIEAIESTKGLLDISLHSFAGDLILGGSYLSKVFLNSQPNLVASDIYSKIRLKNHLFPYESVFDHIQTIVSKYNFVDAFFLQNRVRRFTINGPLLMEAASYFDRKPTYDNNLIEFCYSIPDDLRFKGKVYKKMLLLHFPDFYKDIPWQKTGVPISWPLLTQRAIPLIRRGKYKLLDKMSRLGISYFDPRNYTDYPNWLRQEPARSFFEKILINSAALYPEYISKQQVHQDWERHLNGENHADSLGLYLTFEIWLQQVFAGNYRPNEG